jgi:hypothetical protein
MMRWGSSSLAGDRLADAGPGKNGHHALVGMHRQSVFGRLAGAELLRHDPASRWIIEGNAAQGSAAPDLAAGHDQRARANAGDPAGNRGRMRAA